MKAEIKGKGRKKNLKTTATTQDNMVQSSCSGTAAGKN
jgi:hypothetical protein